MSTPHESFAHPNDFPDPPTRAEKKLRPKRPYLLERRYRYVGTWRPVGTYSTHDRAVAAAQNLRWFFDYRISLRQSGV